VRKKWRWYTWVALFFSVTLSVALAVSLLAISLGDDGLPDVLGDGSLLAIFAMLAIGIFAMAVLAFCTVWINGWLIHWLIVGLSRLFNRVFPYEQESSRPPESW
jgi:flagellar biosynthesis protein FlhB